MNCNDKAPIAQVHLDFHTSPDIKGIGSKFDKEKFQEALRLGNVDSITVFAKCHHGHCYYPTEVSTMHPNLDFDLTGAMVDAAHEVGVRAPIYITAGWSYLDSENHPEWIALNKDGSYCRTIGMEESFTANQPKPNCAWHTLCLNDGNAYTEHIYKLTEEVCKRYKDVDGLFYDICIIGDACYCESCKKGMKEMGLDPNNEEDAKKYFIIKRSAFMDKCMAIMKKYHPNATIFFNSGGADQYKPHYRDYQTHYEMEDLPTAWGGYDKLPMRAKYFAQYGKPFLAMTGKFHLDWGEFGGFKCKEALKAEIATMAMYGAGCSIGDHMHPDCEPEMETYKNIGYAFDYLEKIAPYCYGGETLADIGVFLSENKDNCDANEGVSNILLENQLDYDIVVNNNFSKFKTVIVGEGVVLEGEALANLQKYVEAGGNLLFMGDSLINDGKFQIDCGLNFLGDAEYDCDYLLPCSHIEGIPDAPILCNLPAKRTERVDAEVFAEFITPYFSRTYGHFCGHKNTPHDKSSTLFPAIAKKGNVVYLAHSLARQYFEYGSLYHKRYFMMALNLIHDNSLKIKGMGSLGRCTIIDQPKKNRYCINMVYVSPVKRGCAEIIEDIMPIYNIEVSLKTDKAPKRVYLGVTDEDLDFTFEKGILKFTLPRLECHETMVIDY